MATILSTFGLTSCVGGLFRDWLVFMALLQRKRRGMIGVLVSVSKTKLRRRLALLLGVK